MCTYISNMTNEVPDTFTHMCWPIVKAHLFEMPTAYKNHTNETQKLNTILILRSITNFVEE